MDADYKKQFGVPHLGEDIVVPQASAVYAAADGIVFLVRDGGLTGYSYILIGHRDGYATLYGHVSQALVAAGQEVTAGQQIALSGGTPGMHGSGPMTTAAHLHFEVIRAGVNIDPKSVLP
jgi:murein DD-endopeptidase MepM/ murein hydrolase activator NlpD